jgi:hypothetical protein
MMQLIDLSKRGLWLPLLVIWWLTGCTVPPRALPAQTTTAATPPQSAVITPAAMPAADSTTENLFTLILGPTVVPKGWAVQPCAGAGAFLCVQAGGELVGNSELALYPIETLPEFQDLLAEAGLEPGPLDWQDPAQQAKLRVALQGFVTSYHTSIEADRQAEYGDQIRYMRLETQATMLGDLPGLRFGFVGLTQSDEVYERWVTFVAFDGDLLYLQVAFYRPDTVSTFRSDEELQIFLPYLAMIVAELQLPLPVLATEVQAVQAQRVLEIFRAYGVPTNPVGQVAAGETIAVTGISPDGRYWQVPCPNGVLGNCWIAAGPNDTVPAP